MFCSLARVSIIKWVFVCVCVVICLFIFLVLFCFFGFFFFCLFVCFLFCFCFVLGEWIYSSWIWHNTSIFVCKKNNSSTSPLNFLSNYRIKYRYLISLRLILSNCLTIYLDSLFLVISLIWRDKNGTQPGVVTFWDTERLAQVEDNECISSGLFCKEERNSILSENHASIYVFTKDQNMPIFTRPP